MKTDQIDSLSRFSIIADPYCLCLFINRNTLGLFAVPCLLLPSICEKVLSQNDLKGSREAAPLFNPEVDNLWIKY